MVNEGRGERLAGETASSEAAGAGVKDAATVERIKAAWRDATDALRDSERRYRELVE